MVNNGTVLLIALVLWEKTMLYTIGPRTNCSACSTDSPNENHCQCEA